MSARSSRIRWLGLGAAALLCCAGPDQRGGGTVTPPQDGRGIEINGPALNGIRLDAGGRGADTDGVSLRAVRLDRGVTLRSGAVLGDAVVKGGRLWSAATPDADLAGALLIGQTTQGDPVRLRIEASDPGPTGPGPSGGEADATLYRVSWQPGALGGAGSTTFSPSGEWAPLCPEGERAFALTGRWDYHRGRPGQGGRLSTDPRLVTLACEHGALAKCVSMGYRPWLTLVRPSSHGEAEISLLPLHEACVRAVRADYCGDGQSLTRQGQQVNFYDYLGIQRDEADWPFEAEWSPQGARCLDGTRVLSVPGPGGQALQVQQYVEQHCRPVWAERDHSCVGEKNGRTPLLFTEAPR